MKAVNYAGPHRVKVEEVEKPQLQHPDDIIVKVTTVSKPEISISSLSSLTTSRLPYADQICTCTRAARRLSLESPSVSDALQHLPDLSLTI